MGGVNDDDLIWKDTMIEEPSISSLEHRFEQICRVIACRLCLLRSEHTDHTSLSKRIPDTVKASFEAPASLLTCPFLLLRSAAKCLPSR